MLKNICRSLNGVRSGLCDLSILSQRRLRPISNSVLAYCLHNSSKSNKAGTAAPTVETVSNFDCISSRGFYYDEIYQHVDNWHIKDAQVIEDGKRLQIEWEDGHISRFHSMWLRHNCQCSTCLPYTSTVLVDFSKIDDDLRVTSVKSDGEHVIIVSWEGKTGEIYHEGPFLKKFLRFNCYSDKLDSERRAKRKMKFSDEKIVPVIDYEEVMSSEEGLHKWMVQLSEEGLSLMKNVPRIHGTVGEVAGRIAAPLRTIYGEVFEVESLPNPMNAAYTGIGLDLHMDQIHYESPPGLQLLHCLEFDESIEGGENFFVDMHEVAHKMREDHPDLFHTLTKVPVCIHTLDYKREVPVHVRMQRPMFHLSHKDEIVSVLWQPMLVAPLQVAEKDVEAFYKAYKVFYTMVNYPDKMYTHLLRPGEMICVNNRRLSHGRTEFKVTGRRLLQGCYVNASEFLSKLQMFNNIYGKGELTVRCGLIDCQ